MSCSKHPVGRLEAAKMAATQLPTQVEYALHAWDYYTSTNVLIRDLMISEAGLRTVWETQRESGLLDDRRPFSLQAYVDTRYLDRASKR